MSTTTPAQEPNGRGRELVAVPSVYDRAGDVGTMLKAVGAAIHNSGMFGCETPSQGYVLALECAARRQPPLQLAERYHLIKGKLSMKADAMLGEFRAAGGEHEIVSRTPDEAAIKLAINGHSAVFRLTWSEASQEPFVYSGKEDAVIDKLAAGKSGELKVKPKYATPRSRAQMLWARVVSDGVRAMAPEIISGHYTPEEIGDFTGATIPDAEYSTIDDAPEPVTPAAGHGNGQPQEAASPDNATTAPEPTPAEPEPAPANDTPQGGNATPEQIEEAKRLVAELQVPREKLAAMFQRIGVAKVSDLPHEHCEGLLQILRKERDRRAGKN